MKETLLGYLKHVIVSAGCRGLISERAASWLLEKFRLVNL